MTKCTFFSTIPWWNAHFFCNPFENFSIFVILKKICRVFILWENFLFVNFWWKFALFHNLLMKSTLLLQSFYKSTFFFLQKSNFFCDPLIKFVSSAILWQNSFLPRSFYEICNFFCKQITKFIFFHLLLNFHLYFPWYFFASKISDWDQIFIFSKSNALNFQKILNRITPEHQILSFQKN